MRFRLSWFYVDCDSLTLVEGQHDRSRPSSPFHLNPLPGTQLAPLRDMSRQSAMLAVSIGVVFWLSEVRGALGIAPELPRRPPSQEARPVQVEMKNIHLHVDDGIVLDIRSLRGEMISRTPGRPPIFDDQQSYVLHIDAAEIGMDMASLENLMNRHVFAYEGAPLKGLKVRALEDGRLEQKGTLRKGVEVPFSMKATVGTTPDGRLRLRLDSMKALGVPAKGLMDLFGLELDSLVSLKERRGVTIEDNDILIAPGQILPPPEIRGHMSRAAVVGGRLVQTFAPASRRRVGALTPPDPRARNYIYFSGNDIRFGKLTMSDADLQLIDSDPKDPFDFFPRRYNAQLVAGYSKNTPKLGLKTYMPDFDDLPRSSTRK